MTVDDSDITSRIDAVPAWWDGDIPRYIPFHPRLMTQNARATEVALMRSSCQLCHIEYLTAVWGFTAEFERATNIAESRWLPPLDPPLALKHIGDCDGGPHMSSNPLAVVEYWRRDGAIWRRMPEFEVPLRD